MALAQRRAALHHAAIACMRAASTQKQPPAMQTSTINAERKLTMKHKPGLHGHSHFTRTLRTAVGATALALCSLAAQAQTFPTTSTVPAPVADGACATPTELTIPVSGLGASITDISVSIGLTAAFAGDVTAELVAPGGAASMFLFGRIGKTTSAVDGDSSNFDGVYTFVDPAVSTNNIWTAAAAIGGPEIIPPGNYATTQVGGAGVSSPAPTVPLLSTFSGLTPAQVNGNWTLRVADCSSGDVMSVQSASLTLVQSPAAAVAPVPTLGEWALMLLAGLLAGLGLRRLPRQRG